MDNKTGAFNGLMSSVGTHPRAAETKEVSFPAWKIMILFLARGVLPSEKEALLKVDKLPRKPG